MVSILKLDVYFEDDNRLFGGNSDNGGLSNVNNNWSDNRNDNIGFRPRIVLPSYYFYPTAKHFAYLN